MENFGDLGIGKSMFDDTETKNERTKNMTIAVAVILLLLFFAIFIIVSNICEEERVVYITIYGDKYHSDGCSYLHRSELAVTRDDAIDAGFSPCSRCHGGSETIRILDKNSDILVPIGIACVVAFFLIRYSINYYTKEE